MSNLSSRDVDAFLVESQDVLDDYVTWDGSPDSATWAADGSHERESAGRYYVDDHPPADWSDCRFDPDGNLYHFSHFSQDDIHAMHERTEQVWADLRAAFAPLAEWVRRNIGQDECALAPPVDVEIREDTLRDLVPLDLTRYVDQPPPPPFGPFRHEEPTGRAAQRSTYGSMTRPEAADPS